MTYSFLKEYHDSVVQNCTTYTEVIKNRVASNPDHVVFRFLSDGVNENESFTYYQLEIRSKAIGSSMQKLGSKGDKVLLLFQPGLSYVVSLFACLYSGFVAIPAYPPTRNKGIDRIHTIINDSQAQICIVSQQIYDNIQLQKLDGKNNELLDRIQWIIYDEVVDSNALEFSDTIILPEDIVLLQYTSGSTGSPKGVLVSQMNLLYNSEYIRQSMGLDRNTVGVHWLPVYHDMGLIGGLLQVAYVGGVNIGMPPTAFIKKPINWLRTIEKYGGTISGGPDFTYDYCVRRITDDEIRNLDLSSANVLYCGAEPIRKSTYDKFSKKFSDSKFNEQQFYSCYGLAESTLIVTGSFHDSKPKYLKVDSDALSRNKIKILDNGQQGAIDIVGCGHAWMETSIEVVDPVTLKKVGKDEVGEIWISGPAVATGYWNKSEETERTFGALLADTGEGPFLRSGDLGFLHEGELFVTGRIKDLIIIRGINYYPNDIEYTIQNAIPEFGQNKGAAFSITKYGVENLVIVQELVRSALQNTDFDKITDNIRQVIAEEYELDVYSIVLIKTGSISTTSSGKIQHLRTKYNFLKDDLNVVAQWTKEEICDNDEVAPETNDVSEEAIKEWLISWIMRNQKFRREDIDLDKNIMSYGIDSLTAVTLEMDISKQFGFQWHVSSFMLNPTINGLASEGMEYYLEELCCEES